MVKGSFGRIIMDAVQLATDIIQSLKDCSTERYRESIRKFVKTQHDIWGVSTPEYRLYIREFRRKYPDLSIEDRVATAKILVRKGVLEGFSFGYWLVYSDRGTLEHVATEDLDWILEGLDNWGMVDSLGTQFTGVAWRDGLIGDDTVHGWLRSENPFLRRLAVVSTVPLCRSSGMTGKILAVCRKVVDDHDDTMVKGLSWALRELIGADRKAVENFIEKYDDRIAARVRREVRNKLTTGLKNPKKTGKKS
jgi:3-methyladenine DNA glycosylase AlkD